MKDNHNSFVSQDITFCTYEECPIKDKCFRATKPKKKIASFSDFHTICDKNNDYKFKIDRE